MDINSNFNSEEKNESSEQQEYVSQFSEVEETVGGEQVEEPASDALTNEKKKFFLFKYVNPSIFIAICIFLAALIAFGLYVVFGNKSITGAWSYKISYQDPTATSDEAKNLETQGYYVFDKVNDKGVGTYHEYSQGAEQSGEYKVSVKDDKNVITINSNSENSADLYYEVTGVKLFGGAKLKLTQPEYTDQTTGQKVSEQSIELESSSGPDYESNTLDDYKVDESLLGTWSSDERSLFYYYTSLPYSEKVEVLDNGIIKINYKQEDMSLDRTIYYAYTAEKGKLKLRRATSDDIEEVKYSIKDGKLTFTDKTQSSIFYDAIFGDVAYKKASK